MYRLVGKCSSTRQGWAHDNLGHTLTPTGLIGAHNTQPTLNLCLAFLKCELDSWDFARSPPWWWQDWMHLQKAWRYLEKIKLFLLWIVFLPSLELWEISLGVVFKKKFTAQLIEK